MHTAQPIDATDFPTGDCYVCWNRGCVFCAPPKPWPANANNGIDPFDGVEPQGMAEFPTEVWDDATMEQHARETHAKVLAGELDAVAVYGEEGFDPFAAEEYAEAQAWRAMVEAADDHARQAAEAWPDDERDPDAEPF